MVWKGNWVGAMANIQPCLDVQFTLTLSPAWANRELHLDDIWLDKEARHASA